MFLFLFFKLIFAHYGISLHQYDKSPLTIAGECQAKVNINNHAIHATFVMVDVDDKLPILGRDWMSLLQFDAVNLLELVTHDQIHHTSVDRDCGLRLTLLIFYLRTEILATVPLQGHR